MIYKCDGFVIGSCIKHIPLAGRDITKFIMQMLKDRNEPVPMEDLRTVAKEVKVSRYRHFLILGKIFLLC